MSGQGLVPRLHRALLRTAVPTRVAEWVGLPSRHEREVHDLTLDRSLGGDEPLRVVLAADFHAGPSTPSHLIDKALQHLHALAPDLLLLGGDFVGVHAHDAPPLARELATVPARLGRFAVLGNHDHWAGGHAVARHLEAAGIEMLTNRSVRLPAPFHEVSVTGVDDYRYGLTHADVAFADAARVRLVLMHQPSSLLELGSHTFHAAFCGHTHGGQVALPNGRPLLVAAGPLTRQYNAGRFDLDGGRTLLVTRGVGCSILPLRWNAPSSVLECTVRGTKSRAG